MSDVFTFIYFSGSKAGKENEFQSLDKQATNSPKHSRPVVQTVLLWQIEQALHGHILAADVVESTRTHGRRMPKQGGGQSQVWASV